MRRSTLGAAAALLCGLTLAPAADGPEAGFVPLFNGKDLTGWHVEKGAPFSVKDGVIHLEGGKGWLRSDKEYRDFELRLEFRYVKGAGDSGIFFRVAKDGKYQVQTNSSVSPKGLGSIRSAKKGEELKVTYDADAVTKAKRKGTAWNEYTIRVQGTKGEVRVNGAVAATAENLAERAGYLGIQAEGSPLEFRNLRLKELNPRK